MDTIIDVDIYEAVVLSETVIVYITVLWWYSQEGVDETSMSLGPSSWSSLSQMFYLIGSQSTNSFPPLCLLQWANINYIFIQCRCCRAALALCSFTLMCCSSVLVCCSCPSVFLFARSSCACWTAPQSTAPYFCTLTMNLLVYVPLNCTLTLSCTLLHHKAKTSSSRYQRHHSSVY